MSSPQGGPGSSLEWRISSRCNGGNRVQVAFEQDVVNVRDPKNPDGAVPRYSFGDWSAFVQAAKQGECDY
ncbi:protein of unknown function [Streptosporangium subroseum]|uniref:DUF397 domain-containing protein n=1 Tax=Streptosporangium subroseum TaxID=106412 RepID=A0A239MXY1_9ACTN|nr:DUF397 domain-containing protein [Streptosporangium subroseum]SNT47032.1 protein of unknown function [Streptosporangium subroseum]